MDNKKTTNNSDQQKINWDEYTPLPRHRYPFFIILLGLIVISCATYAFMLFPKYLIASKKIQDAYMAYRHEHYLESFFLYQEVLEVDPSSKAAKIGGAETSFALGRIEEESTPGNNFWNSIAMRQLTKITLDSHQWTRIKKVMPQDFEQYFGNKRV